MRKFTALLAISVLSSGALAEQAPEPFANHVNILDVKISGNGRFIAHDPNGDISIFDQKTGQTETYGRGAHPINLGVNYDLSDDGKHLVFTKDRHPQSDNLVLDVYLQDLETGETKKISVPNGSDEVANGWSARPSISRNGDYVVFVSQADNLTDNENLADNGRYVYMYERSTGIISFVGNHFHSSQGSIPDVTPDGRFVLYDSDKDSEETTTLVNTQTGEKTDIGIPGSGMAIFSKLSDNGRFALIRRGEILHLYDRETGTTDPISVATDGSETPVNAAWGSGWNTQAGMSGDARYIAFVSADNGITEGANNGKKDVFVYDRDRHQVARINVSENGNRIDPDDEAVSVSADGHFVTFSNYVAPNPLFEVGYCEGYEPFNP